MLDSRLLHKTVSHLVGKVVWENNPDEWIHVGLENSLDINLISITIKKHFPNEEQLYLVDERTNSIPYFRSKITNVLKTKIGKSKFYLWNLELNKVIEFSDIGVIRVGHHE